MNRNAGLYAVIGGIVGAVLTMAAGSVLPIGAQNGDATFGEITCTKLNVVDAKGNVGVRLDTHLDSGRVSVASSKVRGGVILEVTEYGGDVFVFGEKGSSTMTVFTNGGRIVVLSKEGSSLATMGADSKGKGGIISVSSAEVPIAAMMGVDQKGGTLTLTAEAGAVNLRVTEHGGRVAVRGKDGKTEGAIMDVNEFGGYFGVVGRGDDNARAAMGVNEYGNGAVSTWDKNGYRLATLGK